MLLMSACGGARTDPEEQVRAWVAAVAAAAQEKERGAIMDLIADGYTDARGNRAADIENLLRLYFLRQGKIVLLTNIEDVTMHGTTAAEVRVTVGMAGTSNSALGISADAYRFELELEAPEGSDGYSEWRLLSARWGALGQPAN